MGPKYSSAIASIAIFVSCKESQYMLSAEPLLCVLIRRLLIKCTFTNFLCSKTR